MLAFSRRFSRTCLEGISFNFFVCFIFNVSLGSAPKRKNFDIQRNTRVGSGGQFTLNYHTPSHNSNTDASIAAIVLAKCDNKVIIEVNSMLLDSNLAKSHFWSNHLT